MKPYALLVLGALCAALALALGGLWVGRDGQLRHTHWQAPAPVTADFAQMLPPLAEPTRVPTARFMALLERPLFSPSRRPPPPPPPPAPPAPVDVFANTQLHAIYAGEQISGVILHMGGKSRRVRLNEAVNGWVLTAVQGHIATFSHSGQVRQLQLIRAKIGSKEGGKPLGGADVQIAPTSVAAPSNAPRFGP